MDVIYKDVKEYNPDKKRKILIVFDDMIADMRKKSIKNKKKPYKHIKILIK